MKKRVIQYITLVLIFTAISQSCKKDEFTPQELTNPNLSEVPDGYFDSEKNLNGFTDRITYQNNVVLWENENKDSLTAAGGADTRNSDDSDLFWINVADVEPFTLAGETLSATHIEFLEDKAYVTYHKRGNTHLGAIEIIDLSDPIQPKVTFKGYLSKAGLDKTMEAISLDHVVLETDSPYLAPTPYRGKRNESGYVRLVAEKLAEVKGISLEEIARITTANAKQIFKEVKVG